MFDLSSYMPLAIAAQFSYYDHLSAFGVYDDVYRVSHGTTEGYVVTENTFGHMGIVFRGSDDIMDWIKNFKVKPDAKRGLEVHSGFLQEFWSIWPEMHDYIKKTYNHHKIFVTGHSKGGVFAALACRSLIWSRLPIYSAATFGCPHFLANKDRWPKILDTAIIRFVNGNDIVARGYKWIGYQNAGRRVDIGTISNWRAWKLVMDHTMKPYVKSLSAAIVNGDYSL